MTDRPQVGKRISLDPEPLSLSRRATYRRVLAVLKAQPHPFVLAGAVGLSLQLGRLIDGEMEVYLHAEDAPSMLEAVSQTGLKVERDDNHGRARVTYGDHRVIVRWALPPPLSGGVDEAWFNFAMRTHFLGLRVKVAPVEELLWLKMGVPSGASVGDPLVGQLLLVRGAELDWQRLIVRMAGLEALLLAHIFLFWHQYPESARAVIPGWVVATLERQVLQGADESTLVEPH